jgi:BCD family chlorophyll transporter-like MFS transporter
MMAAPTPLGWAGIFRLGLVQTAVGSVVVLTNSTLNRVMVVELGLAAIVPGILIGLYYAVELLRPRWGYGSDIAGRRTPWIVGGVAVLGVAGVGAAASTWLMGAHLAAGLAAALLCFTLIGVGVGAAGTLTLTLLAVTVAPVRRAAAGAIVFLMMIAGLAVTAILAGRFLDPFSFERLLTVSATVGAAALALTTVAVWGIERRHARPPEPAADGPPERFLESLGRVWQDPDARRLGIFVFCSMLAFNMQDPILEPFAGLAFGLSVGDSTQLAAFQHKGVFLGMVAAAVLLSGLRIGTMRAWIVAGCTLSALALVALAAVGVAGMEPLLRPVVLILGVGNGLFAATAIGQMMASASDGDAGREGTRIGFWGAAQAIAFGLGILVGAGAADIARAMLDDPARAYGTVFVLEAAIFIAAAALAARIALPARPGSSAALMPGE